MDFIPKISVQLLSAIPPGSLVRIGDKLGFVTEMQNQQRCFAEMDPTEKCLIHRVMPNDQEAMVIEDATLEVDVAKPTVRQTPGTADQVPMRIYWSEGVPLIIVRVPNTGDWRFLNLRSGQFAQKIFNGMTTSPCWRIGTRNSAGEFQSLIESGV